MQAIPREAVSTACLTQSSRLGVAGPPVIRFVDFHFVKNEVCGRTGSLGTPVYHSRKALFYSHRSLLTHPLTAMLPLHEITDKKMRNPKSPSYI